VPSDNNFSSRLQFFLSLESSSRRREMAELIIGSLYEMETGIEDTRLRAMALEILADDIRQYSCVQSDKEKEMLRFEIILIADMIA